MYFNFNKAGVSKSLGHLIDWVMREHEKILSAYKGKLPARAKKINYPQIIWIEAPLHVNMTSASNDLRNKFNKALEKMVQFHPNTTALQLEKVWDPQGKSFYSKSEQIFTSAGLSTYWNAVDKVIRFADTILFKKQGKPLFPCCDTSQETCPWSSRFHPDVHPPADKYHWKNNDAWVRNKHNRTLTR